MTEDDLLVKKLLDKAHQCHERAYATHSEFLDLHEQTLFEMSRKSFPPVKHMFDGGRKESERKMLIFYPEFMDPNQVEKPFACIRIKADTQEGGHPGHRDYLGSLMGLGIKRSCMGDLLVHGDTAHVFVLDTMASYVLDQLHAVGNTPVRAEKMEDTTVLGNLRPAFVSIRNTVASLRLDSVVKLAFGMGRKDAAELVSKGRVHVNGEEKLQPSSPVKEGDLISARGKGKCKLQTVGCETKKNRIFIEIHKYI
ncbi:RNA-binding protein [Anaerotalea alkaliphila]|uniref:RNA-binding protein n=1 Tax=Anaerotalea alkaliphila TaxID=2662126 RepID=A0A7X5KMF7_9FIRM|nr:YlmH/Sll1252 family protein [Anaerotalea alkaliphila]NDL67936.1 RNA-binding protein [Anaerotalea alkaliphila]